MEELPLTDSELSSEEEDLQFTSEDHAESKESFSVSTAVSAESPKDIFLNFDLSQEEKIKCQRFAFQTLRQLFYPELFNIVWGYLGGNVNNFVVSSYAWKMCSKDPKEATHKKELRQKASTLRNGNFGLTHSLDSTVSSNTEVVFPTNQQGSRTPEVVEACPEEPRTNSDNNYCSSWNVDEVLTSTNGEISNYGPLHLQST